MTELELMKNNTEALIANEVLGMFCFNFHKCGIDELCESDSEFNTMWEKLMKKGKDRQNKQGGMYQIDYDWIWKAYHGEITRSCQSLILSEAYRVFEKEVRNNVEFSIEILEKRTTKASLKIENFFAHE